MPFNFPWFRRYEIFFVPAGIPGWIILAAAVSYAVWAFIDIDSRSHSVSDTLMNFAFNLLLIGLAYTLIAFVTSWGGRKSAD